LKASAPPEPYSEAQGSTPPPCWFVYLLRCADGSLYTGITTGLERRLRQHNGDLPGGARYTRSRRPVELVHQEPAPDKSAAQRREAALKQLSRRDKLALIAEADQKWLIEDSDSRAPA
jgi:putative endonuclease